MSRTKRGRRSETRQRQEAGPRLLPALVSVMLIFGVLGFVFLRSVLRSPPTPIAALNAVTPAPESNAGEPSDTLTEGPGEAMPIQGAEHVEPGQEHPAYNSDPPTSGWHLATAIPAGFYEEIQLDEALVHNLEHGHIVIAYDCDKLADCDTVKTELEGLVDRYDGWKVTVVPRSNEDAPLALTAWGRLDKLETYDEARVIAFIDAYRDQGPEKTPE
jgi:hypothetical protein